MCVFVEVCRCVCLWKPCSGTLVFSKHFVLSGQRRDEPGIGPWRDWSVFHDGELGLRLMSGAENGSSTPSYQDPLIHTPTPNELLDLPTVPQ